jgi:DNA anti-recombination protein RmuC
VVYSTSLDKRKEQAIRRQEEREREELEPAVRKLGEQRSACQTDAEGALRRIQEEAKARFWTLQGRVVAEQERSNANDRAGLAKGRSRSTGPYTGWKWNWWHKRRNGRPPGA